MYKVMIVENQAMPRQLMESVINQSDEFECVYSIESSAMAEVYCMNNNIDLILMDICTAMNESGLVAAKEIKIKYPKIKIIMITSMPEYTYLERAREANVESFWYKEISNISILEVMQRTMNGESVYPDSTPVVELGNAKSIDFTDKELEVLKQLTSGDS
ncbi:MAG: response regulator transcription factor, partial [Holdemanella sp.]|nr:response regulator transcription factor [Holdemanella sp.]